MALFLYDFKSLLKNHGIFFAIITLVFVLTTFSVIYIFAFFENLVIYQNYDTEGYRAYAVAFGNDTDVVGGVRLLEEKYGDGVRRAYVAFPYNDDRLVTAEIISSEGRTVFYGRAPETENEIAVPMSNEKGKSYSIGEACEVSGKEYLIVGTDTTSGNYELVFTNELVTSGTAQALFVISEDILDAKESKAFAADVAGCLGVDVSAVEMPKKSEVDGETQLVFVIISLIAALGIVNLAFVYMCLLKRRRREQAILHMLGCEKLRLLFLYVGEMLIMSAVYFIFCAVISEFVILPLVNSADDMMFRVVMSFGGYVKLFAVYIALVVAILSVRTLSYFKKTPAEMRNG